MRLSAIVPATDEPPGLARCLAAIRAADDPPEELIVVETAPRPGPAAARNEGAERAGGDVLVFVDADVLPHKDVFRRIRAAFAADPALTAVFGSYDASPEAPDAVSGFRNLLHHFVHQSSPGRAATFWAGLGAVRRDAFTRAGGFDAGRYREPSIEDIELGMRLVASGAQLELDPDLQGTHLKRWTLISMVQTDFSRRGVPWVALLARRGAVPAGLNLGWQHRLSAAASLTAAGALVARRPRGAATAFAALVAINAPFYKLLLKQRGPSQAAAGVLLHVLHHLTAVSAVPAGITAHLRQRRR
jgi:cellulose synthase/poly-beta-1,6-N-acetylglucosamine synthase-like glycosyltransferase